MLTRKTAFRNCRTESHSRWAAFCLDWLGKEVTERERETDRQIKKDRNKETKRQNERETAGGVGFLGGKATIVDAFIIMTK